MGRKPRVGKKTKAKKKPKQLMADHLIVRKDGVLCSGCMALDPVHPGDGTPLPTFVLALRQCAKRHRKCARQA